MSLPLASGSAGGHSSPFGGSSNNGGGNGKIGGASNSSDSDNFSLSLNDRTTESPSQGSSNLSNTSLLSPLRKMDFSLCKYFLFRKKKVNHILYYDCFNQTKLA